VGENRQDCTVHAIGKKRGGWRHQKGRMPKQRYQRMNGKFTEKRTDPGGGRRNRCSEQGALDQKRSTSGKEKQSQQENEEGVVLGKRVGGGGTQKNRLQKCKNGKKSRGTQEKRRRERKKRQLQKSAKKIRKDQKDRWKICPKGRHFEGGL